MTTILSQPKNPLNEETLKEWRSLSIMVDPEETERIWGDVVFRTFPNGKWIAYRKRPPTPEVEETQPEPTQPEPQWEIQPQTVPKRSKKEAVSYPSLAKASTVTDEQVRAMELEEKRKEEERERMARMKDRMCWSYKYCRKSDCPYAHTPYNLYPKKCSSRRCDRSTCLYFHRDESIEECRDRILWIVDNRPRNDRQNQPKRGENPRVRNQPRNDRQPKNRSDRRNQPRNDRQPKHRSDGQNQPKRGENPRTRSDRQNQSRNAQGSKKGDQKRRTEKPVQKPKKRKDQKQHGKKSGIRKTPPKVEKTTTANMWDALQ